MFHPPPSITVILHQSLSIDVQSPLICHCEARTSHINRLVADAGLKQSPLYMLAETSEEIAALAKNARSQ